MSETPRRKGRLTLIILAVLFLGPLVLAYTTYYGGWRPGGLNQKGNLIDPAQPVPERALYDSNGKVLGKDPLRSKRWTMLYVGSSDCDRACRQQLYNMRQVWKSLGRRAERVKGAYVATDRHHQQALEEFLAAEHGGMTVAYTDAQPGSAAADEWRTFFHRHGEVPAGHNVYIIDPLGNWVLYYTPRDEPKGMLKDIKQLLRLSNIG